MRERVGKFLIGFVVISIFIGLAETNKEYVKNLDRDITEEASTKI